MNGEDDGEDDNGEVDEKVLSYPNEIPQLNLPQDGLRSKNESFVNMQDGGTGGSKKQFSRAKQEIIDKQKQLYI